MSLIDREDLMQTLGITDMDCEKCGWYSRTARRCKRGSDFEDACCAIDDAPEVSLEPKWIPFDEQQPEYRQEILVTIHWHESGEEEYFVQFDTCVDDATLDSNFKIGRDAFAWMPKPEPYREGEQE